MVTINTFSSYTRTSLPATQVDPMGVGRGMVEGSAKTPASIASDTQISGQAKLLSSLYASASDYLKEEYLEAYAGPVKGHHSPGAYIDVGKYNDYLFDKAATTMVAAARNQGVALEKADVLAQLKSDNIDMVNIRMDDASRKQKLGATVDFAYLTDSDIDNFTKTYITAKENGLDLAEVQVLASNRGHQNRHGSALQAGDIYPYDWDFSETDPEKIAAAKNIMPESITLKAEELRSKLQGDLGLGSDFIEFLLNPRIGLRSATDASLTFLSRLADIHSQQK